MVLPLTSGYMKFEINFNRETDDTVLVELGAKLEHYEGLNHSYYTINIDNFDELKDLLKKVDTIKKGIYSAVISFDPPTLYLDDAV